VSVVKRELDVASNGQIIEWLKAELVDTVASLFRSLLKSGSDATVDALANLLIIAFVLGRRLGINFQIIELRVKHKLNSSINDTSGMDLYSEDLVYLQKYLESKESKKR
jgi:hypothetical protein